MTVAVGGNRDLRRAGPTRDDLVALDEHRGVVDRRHLVAGEQHAADERELLRRLRVRGAAWNSAMAQPIAIVPMDTRALRSRMTIMENLSNE